MAFWLPDEDVLLIKCWANLSLSAEQCAKYFPGKTRNAILGRVDRLRRKGKIPDRDRDAGTKARSRRSTMVRKRAAKAKADMIANGVKSENPVYVFGGGSRHKMLVPEPFKAVDEVEPAKLVSFAAWPESKCKWPYGDPVMFGCECKRVPGLPYCEGHAARAYQGTAVKPSILSAGSEIKDGGGMGSQNEKEPASDEMRGEKVIA